MKPIIKKILIALFILVVLASVAGNVYYFGWINLQNYFEQQGFNIATSQILNLIKQNGSVKIGNITLIQQK